jgi:hypothetical protein
MRIEVSNGGSRSQQSAPSAAESAKIIEARPASMTHVQESWDHRGHEFQEKFD